jgi:hypothetical protein
MKVDKYKGGRNWAVYDEAGELVAVTVYKRGANEVKRRLFEKAGANERGVGVKTAEQISEELEDAYTTLTARTKEQTDAELEVMDAGQALAAQRKSLLRQTDPKTLGTNEAQRAANLDGLCGPCVQALLEAERRRMWVRGEFEAAQQRVDGLRCQLRILEIAAGISRAA